jgi:YVTN family beta-propeller protein
MRNTMLNVYFTKAGPAKSLLLGAALCGGITLAPASLAGSPTTAAYSLLTSGYIDVIDTKDNRIANVIPVGEGASVLDITPDGKFLYVTNVLRDTLSVIHAASHKLLRSIPIGDGALAVAVNPQDGRYVYVASMHDSKLRVINAESGQIEAGITFENDHDYPAAIAVAPDGRYVYVASAHLEGGKVSVIDTAGNSVASQIDLNNRQNPMAMAISPDGKSLYIANAADHRGDGNVMLIDTASGKVVRTLEDPRIAHPSAVAVAPDGQTLYVADADSDTISVIDTGNYRFLANVAVGPYPNFAAITPDGRSLYVVSSRHNHAALGGVDAPSGSLYVIDTGSHQVVDKLAESGPLWLAFSPQPVALPDSNAFRYFRAFKAALPDVDLTPPGSFRLAATLHLHKESDGIDLAAEALEFYVGRFARTIPAGSFVAGGNGTYRFDGIIDGAYIQASLEPGQDPDEDGDAGLQFNASVRMDQLKEISSVSMVGLTIGNDSGVYNPCLDAEC